MVKSLFEQIKIAFVLMLFFTVTTGFFYPLLVTGIGQLLFPWQANGSLVVEDNKIIGSALIGQFFDGANYFWSRPSATTPFAYNGASSAGSNMGPSNPDFLATVQARVHQLQQSDITNQQLIPVDLVTASGSGLDPDISTTSAFYQVNRIAKANHLAPQAIVDLIKNCIRPRSFSMLGEPRVNVLELNMALNKLRKSNGRATS